MKPRTIKVIAGLTGAAFVAGVGDVVINGKDKRIIHPDGFGVVMTTSGDIVVMRQNAISGEPIEIPRPLPPLPTKSD